MTAHPETVDDIVVIESSDELEEHIQSGEPFLVDFHAEWCGPCKQLEPVIEALASSMPITVLKVDVDENQQLASEYNVRGVPTLLLITDKEIVDRMVGAQPEPVLRERIQELVGS